LTLGDEGFGRPISTVNGDDRSSFINPDNGHANHLLYLWHIADKMQVLNNVLQVLDADVSADGSRVPRDTSAVQNKRKAQLEEKERQERKAFRVEVGTSLKSIAITTKQEALRKEQKTVHEMNLSLMEAQDAGDERKVKYYRRLVNFHVENVDKYTEQLNELEKTIAVVADDA
jgi:hypothetical protein